MKVVSPTVRGLRKHGSVYVTLGRAVVCTLLYAIMVAHICSDKRTFIIIRFKLLMSGRLRGEESTPAYCVFLISVMNQRLLLGVTNIIRVFSNV